MVLLETGLYESSFSERVYTMLNGESSEFRDIDKTLAISCIYCAWVRKCEKKDRRDKYEKPCDDYCPEITASDI